MSAILQMGILGRGKMGSFHADWIDENRVMKLAAICEKNVIDEKPMSVSYESALSIVEGCCLIGDPIWWINCCRLWRREVDDHFLAVLKFENNVVCHQEASDNGRIPIPHWDVIGTTRFERPASHGKRILFVKVNGDRKSNCLTATEY